MCAALSLSIMGIMVGCVCAASWNGCAGSALWWNHPTPKFLCCVNTSLISVQLMCSLRMFSWPVLTGADQQSRRASATLEHLRLDHKSICAATAFFPLTSSVFKLQWPAHWLPAFFAERELRELQGDAKLVLREREGTWGKHSCCDPLWVVNKVLHFHMQVVEEAHYVDVRLTLFCINI